MHGATNEELAEAVAIVGQTTFWSNVLHAQNYGINPMNLRKNSSNWVTRIKKAITI